MSTYWQTVEYDENSVAWLVDDHNRRVCLEHGMRLQVFGITMPAYPANTPQQENIYDTRA